MEDPKFTDYINPVISALKSFGGSAQPQDVFDYVSRAMNLTDDVLNKEVKSGGSLFKKRVSFARFYLSKAGYIDSSEYGMWTLSEEGKKIIQLSEREIDQLVKRVQLQSRNFKNISLTTDKIEKIDLNKLKLAIVVVLKEKPNESCIRGNLSKEVRKHLGVSLKGKLRLQFDQKVTNAVSRLKQANLIQQYKTEKNTRVRLRQFSENRYQKLVARWNENILENDNDSISNNDLMSYDDKNAEPINCRSDNNKLQSLSELPDLPDIVDPDEFIPPDEDNEDDDYQLDDDTLRRLDTLTNKDSHDGQFHDTEEDEITNTDILKLLQNSFDNTPNLTTEQILNSLKIKVDLSPDPLVFNLEYHPELEQIRIRGYFQIKHPNPTRLLELCGQDNFTSTLGITVHKERKSYVLHKTLSLHLFKLKQIEKMVMQFLTDIQHVYEILKE